MTQPRCQVSSFRGRERGETLRTRLGCDRVPANWKPAVNHILSIHLMYPDPGDLPYQQALKVKPFLMLKKTPPNFVSFPENYLGKFDMTELDLSMATTF